MGAFFSIIIPAYNSARTILKPIQSVLDQTFRNFEIIVVDDGSTDETSHLVKSIEDNRLRYIYEKNGGPALSRNKGAALAQGKYLVFLDSDDSLTANCLGEFHSALADEKHKLLIGTIQFVDGAGLLIKSVVPFKEDNRFSHGLAGSFAISRTLFDMMSGYDPNLFYSENTDLFLRLHNENWVVMDEVFVCDNAGVVIQEGNTRARNKRYAAKKYEAVKYLLNKHKRFFDSSPNDFINYKRILALSSFQKEEFNEARQSIKEVIGKNPFLLKSYIQYFLFCFPVIAKLYYRNG